jgi:hypothetical protein
MSIWIVTNRQPLDITSRNQTSHVFWSPCQTLQEWSFDLMTFYHRATQPWQKALPTHLGSNCHNISLDQSTTTISPIISSQQKAKMLIIDAVLVPKGNSTQREQNTCRTQGCFNPFEKWFLMLQPSRPLQAYQQETFECSKKMLAYNQNFI